MTSAPVLEKIAITFELPRTLGELTVVEPKPTASQRLESALANIAKLQAALESGHVKRFHATLNPVTLHMVKHPVLALGTLAVIPAAVVASAAALFFGSSAAPIGLIPLFLGAVGQAVTHGALTDRRHDKPDALTTADVDEATALLQGLPPSERALVRNFAEQTFKKEVTDKRMTPAASEVLTASIAGPEASPDELRSARSASTVRLLETDSSARAHWQESIPALLKGYPAEEQREVATALLARFFKHERCTLDISGGETDALYRMLRAAQNAKDE